MVSDGENEGMNACRGGTDNGASIGVLLVRWAVAKVAVLGIEIDLKVRKGPAARSRAQSRHVNEPEPAIDPVQVDVTETVVRKP